MSDRWRQAHIAWINAIHVLDFRLCLEALAAQDLTGARLGKARVHRNRSPYRRGRSPTLAGVWGRPQPRPRNEMSWCLPPPLVGAPEGSGTPPGDPGERLLFSIDWGTKRRGVPASGDGGRPVAVSI